MEGASTDAQEPSAEASAPAEISAEAVPAAAMPVVEELKVAPDGVPERREDEEAAPRAEKKEKEKEEKPRSLAAFKVCFQVAHSTEMFEENATYSYCQTAL